jgi:hypothetical protein
MKAIISRILQNLRYIAVSSCLLFAFSAMGTTYYIDYDSGNDSNSGTSKSSPWKHHPYMFDFPAPDSRHYTPPSYTHSAGDRFIFKGGVTVPGDVLVISITEGGTAGNPDYYGVDQTWYSGDAWTRPVLSEQGASVAYDYGYFWVETNYVTIDGFEMTDFYWGPSDYGVYNDPYFSVEGIAVAANYVTIENCYFHGWTHDTFANFYADDPSASAMNPYTNPYDNFVCIRGSLIPDSIGTPNTGCVVSNCVFDGSASGGDSGEAVGGITTVINCVITNMSNGVLPNGETAEISGCTIGPIIQSFDVDYGAHKGQHENAIEPEGEDVGTVLIHNNYIFNSTAACILLGDAGGPIYIYDNLIDQSAYGTIPIQVQPVYISTLYCYNNTLVLSDAGDGTLAIRGIPESESWHLVAENNHTIGKNPTPIDTSNFQTDFVVDHDIHEMTSDAASAGYTSANLWKPTSSSAPTVDYGTDLSSLSSTLPTIATDLFGVPRPQGSAWDVGAYEYRQIINVEFGSVNEGFTTGMSGLAGTGNSIVDYWNALPVADDQDGGTPGASDAEVSCLDGDQNSTSVVVQALYDEWGNAPFGGGGNGGPLLGNFVGPPGGGSCYVAVYMPAGTYDFYLYGSYVTLVVSERPNATFELLDAVSNLSDLTSSLSTSDSSSWDLDTWVEGNQYVVFSGVEVTGGSENPVIIEATGGVEDQPIFNGLQIVPHD